MSFRLAYKRLFLAVIIYFSVTISPAYSALPVTTSTNFEEVFWGVTFNGKDQQESALFLRDTNKHVWIAAKDLQHWRFRIPEVASQDYQGDVFYPLDGFGKLTYQVDETTQVINIVAPADLFLNTTYNNATVSPTPVSSTLGGFLNYDGAVQYDQQKLQLGALTELGVFNSWGVGVMTLAGKDLSDTNHIVRLDDTWTTDIPDSMTSLRFGDNNSRSGQWGGAVHFGGIQWATNFTTQPRFIPFPTLAVAGEAVLPSTVDVFVNNALQLRTDVPIGPFSITNVPVLTGQGDARIVVKDLLGREQVITQPYYVTPQLLSQGVKSFSYEAGLVRQNYGLDSLNYGRTFTSGTFRYGLSDQFTGEAHGEFLQMQQTMGVSGSYLYPELGIFNLSIAGSHSDYGLSPLVAASFQRQLRWLNFALSTRLAGKNYTQIGLRPDALAPSAISSISTGVSFGSYGSLGIGYIQQNNRDKTDVNIGTISYNVSFGNIGSVSLGYLTTLDGEPNSNISLTFTTSLGDKTSASLSGVDQQNSKLATLQVQQGVPRGNGMGYRVIASEGSSERFGAAVNLQNNVGLYNAEVSYAGGQTAYRGNISGGVAMMGLRPPTFSRRLTNSFAMVHVPGIPNVRVYTDNQEVGVTDANGDLLIPQLRAYQRNPIRIEQADLPFDAQFSNLEHEAVPFFRSGYDVNFAIKRSRGALLTLLLGDGKPLPSGALVHIIGQEEEFPVALRGEVFITGMQADNKLRTNWQGQSCEFSVAFPEGEDPLPNLGTFTCLGVKP